MLSKLCKENLPEACMDCTDLRCACTCHSGEKENLDDYNTCDMLDEKI